MATVRPSLIFGMHAIDLRNTELKKLQGKEMKLIRKMLKINWQDLISNEELLQDCSGHEDYYKSQVELVWTRVEYGSESLAEESDIMEPGMETWQRASTSRLDGQHPRRLKTN